ncbi:MAG: hypothetical protein Ct9H300mP11_27000 [Chloroflexota bacterium]|nr:MAG: hypothetical protein Ct9H300mP11_27000 [Chloroflexota bacterium]
MIAPESGTYILALSASGRVADPIGTYSITVTRQNDTLPSTPKVIEPEPLLEDTPPKVTTPGAQH